MPGFDRTGPRGMGPMTGGGRGFCNPYYASGRTPFRGAYPYSPPYGMGYMPPYGAYSYNPSAAYYYSPFGFGRGFGGGRVIGWGRGFGRGKGMGRSWW